MTEDITLALKELKSDRCACGRPKVSGQSFESGCYHSLPKHYQVMLYAGIANGYVENYFIAKKYLKEKTRRFVNISEEE